MLAHKRHHCRGPDSSAPCPTGMPRRSAVLATPPLDAWLQRTTTAGVDHGSLLETQTGTRTSGSEPHRDQSPQWHSHGCVGMSATSAMAVPGVWSCTCVWTGRAVQAGCDDLEMIDLAHLYSAR